ncbi:membrane protein [Candidatus Francisella endociliophora]|uniref:Membrane protein n=1 Tax=Candidatus Francisella endociliophora TaxID=653937 RepID=A0A097EPP6_9GAMM|nr:rhizoferrin import outer membrane protein FslE [Francisella sp. FSC1006]AIT09516.1 membrane protein [Francisella sp. FSC1006]
MINILKYLLLFFILILFTFKISFCNAGTSSNQHNLGSKQLTSKLQSQIQELQTEINNLKQHNSNNGFTTYNSKVEDIIDLKPNDTTNTYEILTNIDEESSIANSKNKSIGGIFDKDGGINVGNAPAITTQGEVTYLGSYSGNNTIPIGMISGNLFASTLFGQRGKFDDYSVFFGGKIEIDAQIWSGSKNIVNTSTSLPSNGQNIYLTAANLYFLSNIGHYVTAQFDFDTTELGSFGLGNAFVIFGNLDTSPFFLTAGRNKLSVGAFGGGGPWTGGITKSFLAPGKVTNVSLNYKDDIWNANIAVFGSNDNQANFSTGLFYAQRWTQDIAVGFNTGYVYNMAGAGNSSLSSFLQTQKKPNDIIGSFDINGNITYSLGGGFLNIGLGWATTTNKKDFNGDSNEVLAGAMYGALNYSLVLGGRNTNFGASYGQSYNATNITMPLAASPLYFAKSTSGIKNQIILSTQRAYFDDNVLFGPEYVYQKLYNGKHMNTVTLDISIYI